MGNKDHTCPSITTGPQYGANHLIGPLTFHTLTIILCGVFTALTLILSGIQLILHATHFSNPDQQIQMLRIIALVPIFAIVFFLAGSVPSSAVYIQAWADVYESVALASYFLLLVTYVVPDPQQRDEHFDRLQHPEGHEGSLAWYHRIWIAVFQYVPISIIVAAATDIAQATGTYCVNGHSVHFAHIWLTVIHTISVAIAFLRLLQFYRHLRPFLTPYAVIPKLVAIKGIVLLNTLQGLTFSILTSSGAMKPGPTLSYDDIFFGVPSILICAEMVLFSVFNFYAYSFKPYTYASSTSSPNSSVESQHFKPSVHYQGGVYGIKAFTAALNPLDIAEGLVLAVRYFNSHPQPQGNGNQQHLNILPIHSPQAPSLDNAGHHQGQIWRPDSIENGRADRYTPLPR
ncbi:organic solute transporter Ostalpha-domain-containing protein [Usnea florida]